MNRRDFSVAAGALGLGQALLPTAQAQMAKPEAGVDYLVLDKRAPVEAPAGKIEVVDFFWYNCPHCNAFEPSLDAWVARLPKDVVLRRVPVGFRDDFVPQQRLFYTLEAMGLVDKLHAKVFTAIHAENQDLTRGEGIANWVAKQGVDKNKFMEQFSSFSIATKASKATQLQNVYKVEGVPALGVAGRFYTDGTMAKSMPRALQIVDYLVAEVRAKR
ncbi:MAG: thiol:disulfide interchange protein DsbA/DsbL [Burkholderiaceae bacterium]